MTFSFTDWLFEMLRLVLFPFGQGFWNHIALVGALMFLLMVVGTYMQKFGTDPDAPFEL